MKKRMITLLMASAMAVTTIAAPAAVHAEEKKTVGYTYYYSSEFITLMNQGVEQKCEELGLDLVSLDAENDPANQITQVENLIGQGVDCLLVAAVDSDAIVPALDMAKEAGIPLVAVNMTINTDEDYYYSGPDDVLAGELEMQSAIDAIGGSGKICILEGPIGQSAQIDRLEGNENVLAENPDIEVLADQTANWSREEAQSLVENWLQTFDDIDAI
ncbi:MAG: substrate-binding domain-containing protein, partial [Blautia sp.]|nr:substrate-binding domain-containing protein [Blautia sp.]